MFTNIEFITEDTYQFIGTLDPSVMILRSVFALCSHALYAALSAAGYWFVTNGVKDKIKNVRFIIWMILPIMMHMIWNGASILLPDSDFSFYILAGIQVIFFIFLVYLIDCIVREHNRENYNDQSIIIDY